MYQEEFSSQSAVNDTDDREARKRYWFIVETRMNHEKKVREQLTKIGVECFLASQLHVRQWKYRKTTIEHILIPMKVFVYISQAEKSKVLELLLVTRFMQDCSTRGPVIIPKDQMDQFMFVLKFAEEKVVINESTLIPGVQVRVLQGPLQGLVGDFISQSGSSKIRVLIDVLGSVSVDISIEDIEKVE